jgi:antitoxin component YwqK of YwqJK toxin-antitoxin module
MVEINMSIAMKNITKISLMLISLLTFSCKQNEQKEETTPPEKSSYKEVEEFPSGPDMVMQKTYYPSGQLKAEGNLKNGLKTGVWYSFYDNGLPWSETEFKDGVRHGLSVSWYKNGQKRYEGYFNNGEESGKWTYWDENGNLQQEIQY